MGAPLPRARRVRDWGARVWSADGSERQTVLLVVKSGLAAVLAWTVSYEMLDAQSPAFAPFSAVLTMQVTVYQSISQAARYAAAVALGVVMQGALATLVGPTLLAFALVALAAMALSRWRRLATQGTQVATAAFFAFSTYVASSGEAARWQQLGEIVLLVAVGCTAGVAVNVLVLPPMRYRTAEHGIRALSRSLGALIDDMQRAMCEGGVDAGDARGWRRRAAELVPWVRQAESAVHTAEESVWYNPRRIFPRYRGRPDFSGYRELTGALERVVQQVGSMTRSFEAAGDLEPRAALRDFLRGYAALLDASSDAVGVLADLTESRITEQGEALGRATDAVDRCFDRLTGTAEDGALPLADASRPFGILLAEANRLAQEIRHTGDVLKATAGRGRA